MQDGQPSPVMELPNPYNEPPAHTLESVLKLTCAPSSWLHRTLPVCAAGLLGVASLLLPPPAALLAAAPELAALPPWAQRVLPSLNPLLLVLGFSAIGGALAHRAGLHSILAGTAQGQPTPVRVWIACAGWGLLVGAAVHTLDRLLAPALGQAWQDLAQTQTGSPESRLLVGLVYGGLAEEVIARWGLMSALTWGGLRLLGPAQTRLVLTLAVMLSALAFGAAHLPVLAAQIDLSAALIGRTLLLNVLGASVYGWLFCRHHLEAAMVAHAASHLGLWALQAMV